jgi:molybdenum cofactor biosynthesis enzyme MoaA
MARAGTSPESVIVTIESPCDLRCVFCTRGRGGSIPREGPFSPLGDLLFQVDTLAATGARGLVIGGDEPTAHPDLAAVVRHARRRGLRTVHVETAGVRLGEGSRARELRAAGAAGVQIPLYGPTARVHDAVTGVRGSFRRTLAGIRAALAAGLEVSVRTVALRGNVRHLGGLVDLARRLGVDPPGVNQVMPRSGDPADYRRVAPSYRQVVASLARSGLQPTRFPECVARRISPARAFSPELTVSAPASPWPTAPYARPFFPPRCRGCVLRRACPGTFVPYVAVHGDADLQPVPRATPLRAYKERSAAPPTSSGRPRARGARPAGRGRRRRGARAPRRSRSRGPARRR